MAKDLVYYVEKTDNELKELGEIQSDFNMSFVLDGTKDTWSCEVLSYTQYEIEPNTIIYHQKTNTWWIARNDKTERHASDNGFFYIHKLELIGAIELLNARDLVDCGFNSKTYTINQFIERLISLSNFEYTTNFNLQNNIDGTNIVDYVKVYQNYTLLSALREFFDGYNCSTKMSFNTTITNNKVFVSSANIYVFSKAGNANENVIDITEFEDVRETRNIGINSFGTTVLSNAENVISTKAKTYPSQGVVKLSSKTYEVEVNGNSNNAILRLPTKAYTVNWIRFWADSITLEIDCGGIYKRCKLYSQNKPYSKELFDQAINELESSYPSLTNKLETLRNSFDSIYEKGKLYCSVTLFNGVIYNPDDTFTIPSNIPYVVEFRYNKTIPGATTRKFALFPKEVREAMNRPWQGVAWERGSDEITGFDLFSLDTGVEWDYLNYNDANSNSEELYNDDGIVVYNWFKSNISVDHYHNLGLNHYYDNIMCQVNYIPMSDLRIKVENQQEKRDVHIYNQNGKFIDSVALSKLLNSYAEEISSDTITRFMTYYDVLDVPNVGQIVLDGNKKYIINNVSIDFFQNEQVNGEVSYFIQAEITLSKIVAIKSLNINANSNIRDYGIPQNNNVERKQLYRDYFELAFSFDGNVLNNYYTSLDKILKLKNEKSNDRQAIIKIEFDSGSIYYYQLSMQSFPLKKQFIEIAQFKDNNIIGYCSQNNNTGFDLSRLFQNDFVNVPISYVDQQGRFKGINIVVCDTFDTEKLFDDYIISQNEDRSLAGVLQNYPFIPKSIYDNALNSNNHDYTIIENNYNKDALEVPVFEHAIQLNDSEEVIIGPNVFDYYGDNKNIFFVYGYELIPKNKANEFNALLYSEHEIEKINIGTQLIPFYTYRLDNACNLYYGTDNQGHDILSIDFYQYWQSGWFYTLKSISVSYDLVVYRYAYNRKDDTTIKDLMFIARLDNSCKFNSNQGLVLNINHYKVDK